MIIDFHTHIFSPTVKERREYYVQADPLFAQLYSDPRARLASTEELIAAMEKQGIASSVVLNIGWSSPELCRESNDYIIESVARYPEKLFAFVMVDFNSPQTAINELARCVKTGIKGVGEVRFSSDHLSDPGKIKPVLDYIIENELILLVHTSEPLGHSYPGKGDSTPALIYPFITRFPNLKLVCAHWGGGLPFYALMPEIKRALSQVYFDSAATPYLYSPGIYNTMTSSVGDQKLLFGSDYPLLNPQRLLKEMETLNLPETTLNRILYTNAAALLGLSK
jgi:predicted TIM-barrel fold metal-dependent hydrolase